MKKILNINQYFNKVNESKITPESYFTVRNESKFKDLLMKQRDFAEGDVLNGIIDVAYNYWQKPENKNLYYDNIVDYVGNEYGFLPLFCLLFGSYNGQVCNGGHNQYFYNGYASSTSRGLYGKYEDIEKHEEFVLLFKDLDFDTILPHGKIAYDIILSFELNLEDEIETCSECDGDGKIDCSECNGEGNKDCPECDGSGEVEENVECGNCDGKGYLECDECESNGKINCDNCGGEGEEETGEKVPEIKYWETLDTRWYKINTDIEKELNDYLKTLTLNGEKITDLIELAKSTQNYNL